MISTIDYIRILPELVLSIFGIAVMMIDPLLGPKTSRKSIGVLALIGTLSTIAATLYQAVQLNADVAFSDPAWFGMVRVDSFSIFFHLLIAGISGLCILASLEYFDTQDMRGGEYYGLILFGTVGMVLMSCAIELVLIFIALEISSISTYILAGYRRRNASGVESAVKYFLLGSFATAFFLYGVAMIFGATGSTSVVSIAAALKDHGAGPLVYAAAALMLIGLGFKIAAAPFHVWTPDVYEGAPAPVVALMSTGPKAAAFAVLLRVLFSTGIPVRGWFWLVWITAALSMTLGNFGALRQNNVKRMLAYSSIAHAGYLLVAFAAYGISLPEQVDGMSAAIFYTAAYAAMNVGAFIVISHFAGKDERFVSIDDYAGLGRRSPLLAFTLTIFLLSLIGIPLTGGFLAKYYVFTAALRANLVWLSVIGLVNSAVAAYYYLRLIVVMYMREPSGEATAPERVAPSTAAALLLASIATVYLGTMPGNIQHLAEQGAKNLKIAATQSSAAAATPMNPKKN
ncbi:MAG TPA: NADH-quinone oxidoreductase subunit N [Candidatus Saccharimonadales bacterium]|jgi:NADH-quinone oxidoreductase subunit N|nr:NADH-quinone oxidoreductase subunit N [Candidatus Saccharimonadales bacterium]